MSLRKIREGLDLNWLRQLEEKIPTLRELEWRKVFYDSLGEEVKRMICRILLLSERRVPTLYAKEAKELDEICSVDPCGCAEAFPESGWLKDCKI